MKQLSLGASGLSVSSLGWGMWRFAASGRVAARLRVDAALEAGYTLFDTADVYGYRGSAGIGPDGDDGFGASEALLGSLLRADPSLRARMVLASKAGVRPPLPYNASADYLVRACEASLERLGTDHLDLYFIHRPDLLAHPHEMAGALERLHADGKIRAAGVSNFSASQTAALLACLPMPLASVQIEFSPLAVGALSDGVLDLAMTEDIPVLAWSPLSQGRLMSSPTTPTSPQVQAVRLALDAVAARHGVSREVAAYAWIRRHPSRPVPLVGSQDPERIRAAVPACDLELSRAEWYAVLQAALGQPLP